MITILSLVVLISAILSSSVEASSSYFVSMEETILLVVSAKHCFPLVADEQVLKEIKIKECADVLREDISPFVYKIIQEDAIRYAKSCMTYERWEDLRYLLRQGAEIVHCFLGNDHQNLLFKLANSHGSYERCLDIVQGIPALHPGRKAFVIGKNKP